MRYHLRVNDIKTGDLLLCRGNWIMSKCIRWVTGGQYSHAGIAVWLRFNGTKRLCMFEAMEGSDIRIVPVYDVLKEYYWPYRDNAYIIHKPLLRELGYDGDKLIHFLLDRWSFKYANWWQFFVIASPRIQWFRSKIFGRNEDTDKDKYHCSELVATALEDQGYELNKTASLVTPSDLDSFTCFGPGEKLTFSGHQQILDNCRESY